jgi:prepilin-type N-terminal cleavage/methylation domain-containing protein
MRAKLAQHLMKKAQGFTLIELLVVIVIVGILSAVAIPTFLNQIRRARTAEAQTALSDVSRAAEEFRLDQGVYPVNAAVPYKVTPGDRSPGAITFNCGVAAAPDGPGVAVSVLDCLGGASLPTTLSNGKTTRLYMTDPFGEKAPNFSRAGAAAADPLEGNVWGVAATDGSSGILFSAVANTPTAKAYKTNGGTALDCRLGLGTASALGTTLNAGNPAAGPNLDSGCNLKLVTKEAEAVGLGFATSDAAGVITYTVAAPGDIPLRDP